MKTLQEQYNLIKEGKGNTEIFLKSAKQQFPKLVRNAADLNETIGKLKSRNVISENLMGLDTRPEESWETKFKNFLKEAKKEDLNQNQYDYTDKKNLDNQIAQEVLNGIEFEAKKTPEKNIEEIKSIVSKNLAKDPLYYMHNAFQGIEGLGVKQEEAMQASGDHACSGYGEKLSKLVKESLSDSSKNLINENMSLVDYMNQVLTELNEEDTSDDMPMDEMGETEEVGEEYGVEEYEDGSANEITSEVEEEIEKDTKGKKPKKETVQKTLSRIENIGTRQALEAKMEAIDEEITKRNEQLTMLDENEVMAELMDKKKIKELQKEIKVLEKQKAKYEKTHSKYQD